MQPTPPALVDTAPKPAPAAQPAIVIQVVSTAKQREEFLRVPWVLGMQHDPRWVAPLLDDYRRMLDPKKSAFLPHGELECYIAYVGGQAAGRICAHVDFDYDKHWPDEPKTAFFGFFECKNDMAVARALFAVAETFAKRRGRTRVLGPFTLDSKGEMGLLVDGFEHPPRIGTSYNKPYLAALVEGAGFSKAKDLYCFWYNANSPIDPLTKKISARTRALPNVRVRTASLKHMQREVDIVRDIYNEAWSKNWSTVPFTAKEMEIMASDYKVFIDPEIVLIAEVDGEPAALCLAVPDVNEVIKDFDGELMRKPWNLVRLIWRLKFRRPKAARLILLGVKEKYRASRKYGALVAVLYEEVAMRGSKRGYQGGELGWTLEDNVQINKGIERMGAKHYKTYRVFERDLSAPPV
jgi:hypothetical protein